MIIKNTSWAHTLKKKKYKTRCQNNKIPQYKVSASSMQHCSIFLARKPSNQTTNIWIRIRLVTWITSICKSRASTKYRIIDRMHAGYYISAKSVIPQMYRVVGTIILLVIKVARTNPKPNTCTSSLQSKTLRKNKHIYNQVQDERTNFGHKDAMKIKACDSQLYVRHKRSIPCII